MAATTKKKFRLKVHEDYCKSCRLCVDFCPKKVLEMTTDRLNAKGVPFVTVVRCEDCMGCMNCTVVCPDAVIELFQEDE